ncbi:MAG TPA: ribonuclease HII [Candidatus Edwardsbacteria bacterium]|nr:ribonuclease HII [Candidatus Edwardsbacteria bacterium]
MTRRDRPGAAGFDHALRSAGVTLLAGVDEAGRGPLAGPVVAAAVILDPGAALHGVDDSKALSARQRERAFAAILEHSVAVGLGVVDARRIDAVNILEASLEAMAFALCGLRRRPHLVLVDGPRAPRRLPAKLSQVPVRAVVDGDARSLCIAAASIVAKCVRDSMMRGFERDYPGYGFARHKGYGTAAHLAALRRLGPCPIHRASFAPVRALLDESQQQ